MENSQEGKLIVELRSNLQKKLPKYWTVVDAPKFILNSKIYIGDLWINRGNSPIAIIECKKTDKSKTIKDYYTEFYTQYKDIKLAHVFLTDGVSFFEAQTEKEGRALTFNDFIARLLDTDLGKEEKEFVLNVISTVLHESNLVKLSTPLTLTDLCFQKENYSVHFTEEREDEIFSQIVPQLYQEGDLHSIYRFTTIGTIFSTLQNSSFRMFSVEGMNDKEDCDFLWKSLYGSADKNDYIKDKNTLFLMSCTTTSPTDLTMWRLYGDDTKGGCLILKLPNQKLTGNFYLSKIIYSNSNEYKFVKQLVDFCHVVGPTFTLIHWSRWSSFFKNNEYKIENEVRLIYEYGEDACARKPSATGWVLTDSNRIANHYADFAVTGKSPFPLKLSKIIVGRNSDELEVNVKQFKQMVEESSGFRGQDIEVSAADSTSYRPAKK